MANEDKFAKTVDDDQLDEIAGGTKGDYQQIYGILKANGAVDGDINNWAQISRPEEVKKVQGIISQVLGGAVEIGQFNDRDNVYWYNGVASSQSEIAAGLKQMYSAINKTKSKN